VLHSALAAWEAAKAGDQPVISDAGLDALDARIGILDAYLLRLSPKGRATIKDTTLRDTLATIADIPVPRF
jgi:hypothetical protein